MITGTAATLIVTVTDFYVMVIFVYILMSWIPRTGFIEDIYNVLATVCEPYLGLFRRFIPPIGGTIDISPIVAVIVLQLLVRLLV